MHAFKRRWFQVAATAPAAALGAHMVKRLRAFAGMSRMKRLALVVLARTLTDNDVKRLRELFAAMDTNQVRACVRVRGREKGRRKREREGVWGGRECMAFPRAPPMRPCAQ
jgi:hypothetical protein